MIKKFFFLDNSPVYKNKYVLRFDFNLDSSLFPNGTFGSYNVFPARLLDLSYAEYLRYCRDRLGAELIGKGDRYIIPYFDNTETTQTFVKLLNSRINYIINERNFPYEYMQNGEEIIRKPLEEANENNG